MRDLFLRAASVTVGGVAVAAKSAGVRWAKAFARNPVPAGQPAKGLGARIGGGEQPGQFLGREFTTGVADIAVAYSPDGQRAATGSEDGTVRMWKANTGEAAGLFHGHKDHVYAVAFSPDGKRVASGGRDGTTAVWDLGTGEQAWAKDGYGNSVTAVAFSPDGKTVAAGGRNFRSVLRSADTGDEVQTLKEDRQVPLAVAYTPDGKHLVVGGESVWVWDLKAAEVVKEWPSTADDVRSLAVSPDGKRLTTGSVHAEALVWEIKPR